MSMLLMVSFKGNKYILWERMAEVNESELVINALYSCECFSERISRYFVEFPVSPYLYG